MVSSGVPRIEPAAELTGVLSSRCNHDIVIFSDGIARQPVEDNGTRPPAGKYLPTPRRTEKHWWLTWHVHCPSAQRPSTIATVCSPFGRPPASQYSPRSCLPGDRQPNSPLAIKQPTSPLAAFLLTGSRLAHLPSSSPPTHSPDFRQSHRRRTPASPPTIDSPEARAADPHCGSRVSLADRPADG